MQILGRVGVLAVLSLLVAVPSAHASSIAYTDLTGRDWRQLTETSGLSWDELAGACGSGPCTADVGSYDLIGWNWASQSDVAGLFNEFIFAATGTTPLGSNFNAPGTSAWASSFLSFFAATYVDPGTTDRYVNGWSSTAATLTDGFGPSIRDCDVAINVGCLDRANVGDAYDTSLHFPGIAGAWLYQESPTPAPIPEPATLVLLGSGLAAALVRHNRASR